MSTVFPSRSDTPAWMVMSVIFLSFGLFAIIRPDALRAAMDILGNGGKQDAASPHTMSRSRLQTVVGGVGILGAVLFAYIAYVEPGTSTRLTSDGIASILLFAGAGTSAGDVAAVETILNSNHLNYSTANSSQLNRASESEIRRYRLLIVPGGNFVDIGTGLTPGATANIRSAVENGLNYLGICAGAFFAGNSGYNGLNLTWGVRFPFYAAENSGVRKTAVAISMAGGSTFDQYWEDGPQLTGWGAIVGKYPNGTPAIVGGTFGRGWVILTGVHPEAPDGWRHGMTFTTSAATDNAYAKMLISAALDRLPLAHY